MLQMVSPEECKAIQNLRSGKSEGFKIIFHFYHKQLFLLSKKYLKDTHLAEDVVQEVFIKVWLKRESLDPERSIKGFLITCLQNHIRNIIRNRKRKILGSYELKETHHPGTNCTQEEMQFAEYQAILKDGIAGMPEKRKEIFRLKVLEGLSNAEVAKKLGVSINTVKAHSFQGNKFMKSYLKKAADIVVNT